MSISEYQTIWVLNPWISCDWSEKCQCSSWAAPATALTTTAVVVVSSEVRNFSLELRNVSLELRNVRPRTTLFQQTEYVLDSSPGVEKIKMKIKISFKMNAWYRKSCGRSASNFWPEDVHLAPYSRQQSNFSTPGFLQCFTQHDRSDNLRSDPIFSKIHH